MNSIGGITINLMIVNSKDLNLAFSYFSMAGHEGFLSDVSITFIDKTDQSDPLRRKVY